MDSGPGKTPKRSLPFERNNRTLKLVRYGMNKTYTENKFVSSKTKPMFEDVKGTAVSTTWVAKIR